MKSIPSSRNQEIIKLRVNYGWGVQEIGKKFNISHQRVVQILQNADVSAERSTTRKIREAKEKAPSLVNLSVSEFRKAMNIGRVAAHTIFGKLRHAVDGDGNAKKGYDGELFASAVLEKNGISNKLMPLHHPFDILLASGKTIDVKTAYSATKPPSQKGHPYYNFNVKNAASDLDFFMFVLFDVGQVYIVPVRDIPLNSDKFRITRNPVKYAKYKDAFHLLK